jgi:branched-subunit amino acid transport protein
MVDTLTLWAVIVIVGGLNYLSRLSFVAFFANRSMPPWLARSLKFVPVAMLTALTLPMIVAGSDGANHYASPRVAAAIVAGIVAFRVRNTLITLAAGMATLWLLEFVLHASGASLR